MKILVSTMFPLAMFFLNPGACSSGANRVPLKDVKSTSVFDEQILQEGEQILQEKEVVMAGELETISKGLGQGSEVVQIPLSEIDGNQEILLEDSSDFIFDEDFGDEEIEDFSGLVKDRLVQEEKNYYENPSQEDLSFIKGKKVSQFMESAVLDFFTKIRELEAGCNELEAGSQQSLLSKARAVHNPLVSIQLTEEAKAASGTVSRKFKRIIAKVFSHINQVYFISASLAKSSSENHEELKLKLKESLYKAERKLKRAVNIINLSSR